MLLGDSADEVSPLSHLLFRTIGGYKRISSTHLTKAFGTKARLLPVGLPYEKYYGFPFDVLGDVSILMSVFNKVPPAEPDKLRIFGAFSEETHSSRPSIRKTILESARGFWAEYPVDRQSRFRYLADMRLSGLVACPRGKGLDTYRFWEAIYVGATPIILNPPRTLRREILGLPFIALESWEELEDFSKLEKAWSKLKTTPANYGSASIEQVWQSHTQV